MTNNQCARANPCPKELACLPKGLLSNYSVPPDKVIHKQNHKEGIKLSSMPFLLATSLCPLDTQLPLLPPTAQEIPLSPSLSPAEAPISGLPFQLGLNL